MRIFSFFFYYYCEIGLTILFFYIKKSTYKERNKIIAVFLYLKIRETRIVKTLFASEFHFEKHFEMKIIFNYMVMTSEC
jgi:hypothetical protein